MDSSNEEELVCRSYELRKFFRTTTSNRAMVNQFVVDVEVEANRIRAAMHTLELKLDRWKEIAEMYKSLASPIHTVPPEVLSSIFEFACEENDLSRTSLPQVMIISMVCGRWRDIALLTPKLWSSFALDLDPWKEHFQALNELTTKFIEQSQTAQLRLTLILPANNFEEGSVMAGAVPTMKLLVSQCDRWRSLELYIPRPHFPAGLLQPIGGHLPVLTHLTLKADESEPEWNFELFDLFNDCPSLRSFEIRPWFCDLDILHIPWLQLESLHIRYSYANRGLEVLDLCPQVQTLELYRVGGLDEEGEDFEGHVVLPQTSSADICAASQDEVDTFFRHTTLPMLSSLTVRGDGEESDSDWTTWADPTVVQHFLDRSKCTITSLSLRLLPITDVQTLDLLRMIPSLESLTIDEHTTVARNRNITKTFLEGLARPATYMMSTSIPPFLPRLAHMKMILYPEGLDKQALVRALTARWDPYLVDKKESNIAYLASVEIVLWHQDVESVDNKALDCLQCFKDAGKKLLVAHMP